jgi:hypothetical protein
MNIEEDENGEAHDQEEAIIRDQGLEDEELSQEIDAFKRELRKDVDKYTRQMDSISENMAITRQRWC